MDKEQTNESKEKEYLETLQRLQAEFENFRKRTEREKVEIILNAQEGLITELLDIIDDFELSLKYTKDDGIKMIYSELYSLLEKKGLKKIDAQGKFNPKYHEALIQEESKKEEGMIIEELQKGYMINDKIIRVSKVKIAKKGENKDE